MNKEIKFRMVAYTDAAGKYNPEAPGNGNEDNFYVDDNLSDNIPGKCDADKIQTLSECGCIMVVADGMGGMNAGEVASKIAIDTVSEFFAPDKITKQIAFSHKNRKKYMESVISEADARIKKESKSNEEHRGMGSTIIMAWIVGDELTLSWCGDSRAYRYNEVTGIEPLSKDHSYVQSLVDKHIISYDDMFDHPQGNIITNSLGDTDRKAEPETRFFNVYNSDIILLCSDGLSGVLRDKKTYDSEGNLIPGDTLEEIIANNHTSLKECREVLWDAAEKADWYDNVTAVLCEIISGAEVCPPKQKPKQEQPLAQKSSIVNIKLNRKGIIATLVSICLLIALTAGITWKILSAKVNSPLIETQEERADSVKSSEPDLDPKVVTLKSELIKRAKDLENILDPTIAKDLVSRINEATDEKSLSAIENELSLWEQKAPLLKEIALQLKQSDNNTLKQLRETILKAKTVDSKWSDQIKTAVKQPIGEEKEEKKEDKKKEDKKKEADPELTPSLDDQSTVGVATSTRLSKYIERIPDVGFANFKKDLLSRYRSDGAKELTSIQLIQTDKDGPILLSNGKFRLGKVINESNYNEAIGKPAMAFFIKK